MKRGLCFIGIFLSLLVMFASVPPSSKAEEAATPLRVGIFPFEPINYTDETGQAQGLYPDLLKEIAREENWQLEFVPGSWSEGLDRLQSGDIDLMVSVAYSKKRAEIMDFTHESVMELWGQVFVRPEGIINNISDLAGRRVAVMRKGISGTNFRTTAREFNVQCDVVEFPTHEDVFAAVKEGAVDAGVAPQHFGLRHFKAYDLVPSTIQFSPFSIYFAVKKGQNFDVLTIIDRQLILWKQDKGSIYYQQLSYWLGVQTYSPHVLPMWLLWTLAIIMAAVILLVIMNMILKSQVKNRTRELMASESYNRMLFDQSLIGLAVARMDGKLVDVNSAYVGIIGRSIDETLNLTYWDITPDKYVLQEQQMLATLNTSGVYGPYEKEYIHKDGYLVPVRLQGTLIELKGEKCILSSVEDITERKQTEKSLVESEKQYRSLFENMNAGFVLFEVVQNEQGIPVDLIILDINEGFEKTTGLNLKDAVGMHLTTVLPGIEKDEADWIGTYSKIALTGEASQFEQGSELLGYYYSISAFKAGPKQCAVTFVDITEQKQAELELAETEERLRLATEQANIAVWEYDFNANSMSRSKNHDKLYGLELQAKWDINTFLNATHPDDREYSHNIIQTSVAPGGPDDYSFDFRVVCPDNSIRWLMVNGRVVERDANRQGIRVRGTLTDITVRKKVELSLRESEERFRRAITGAPFPIMIHAEDGQVVTINTPWTRLTGYEHSDIPTIADWTRKAYGMRMDLVRIDIDSLFSLDGPKAEGESAITTSSGDSRIWDFSSAPIGQQPDGRRLVISMAMDVTERKQAEENLAQMSRLMKNSQEIAHLGSFEYVAADQTTIWSEEEYRIYGLDSNGPSPEYEVMLGKCIHPDDAKRLHDTFMAAMQNQGVYELEHRIVRPDGSVRWVFDKAHPYFNEQGKLLRYVGATLDITARKRAREELENLNAQLELKVEQRTAQLEAANKELESFSYSVSHDLRAPLRHISGYVDLLNKRFQEALPEKAGHYLNEITDSAKQMGILIDDLLQFSRTGRQKLRQENMDMNAAVQEVLEKLKEDTKNRKIFWTVAKLPLVFGDYSLLKQVWINLLENAVKYTRYKDEAEIEVGLTRELDHWVFFVRDNGAGFDMRYAYKLFGVFQRLHSSAEFEGTGIGLANVQRIVHKHGGRVWAEAHPDKGATFYFTIHEKTFDEGGKS